MNMYYMEDTGQWTQRKDKQELLEFDHYLWRLFASSRPLYRDIIVQRIGMWSCDLQEENNKQIIYGNDDTQSVERKYIESYLSLFNIRFHASQDEAERFYSCSLLKNVLK